MSQLFLLLKGRSKTFLKTRADFIFFEAPKFSATYSNYFQFYLFPEVELNTIEEHVFVNFPLPSTGIIYVGISKELTENCRRDSEKENFLCLKTFSLSERKS